MFDFHKFRPLGDRVLLKRVAEQDVSDGGIIIPDMAKEKAQVGKVIAVGDGRQDASGACVPLRVKAGFIVYFGKYSGTDMEEGHLVIREDEILGVVEEK